MVDSRRQKKENESLTSLVSRLDGMKLKVDKVEASVNTLTEKSKKRGQHIETKME